MNMRCRAAVDAGEKKLWTVPLLYGARGATSQAPELHIFDTETSTVRVPTKVSCTSPYAIAQCCRKTAPGR
jgi:hypothetical protein